MGMASYMGQNQRKGGRKKGGDRLCTMRQATYCNRKKMLNNKEMLIIVAACKPMLNTRSLFKLPHCVEREDAIWTTARLCLYLGKIKYRRRQTAGLWLTYPYSQKELLVNSWTLCSKIYQTELLKCQTQVLSLSLFHINCSKFASALSFIWWYRNIFSRNNKKLWD